MDFVRLKKPCNPQEANVEVAHGAMPTDGALAIGIDLSISGEYHGHIWSYTHDSSSANRLGSQEILKTDFIIDLEMFDIACRGPVTQMYSDKHK